MTKWLTTQEASEQLGVSQRTIQRYIKQGLLKTKTIKSKTKIKDDSIEAYKTGVETTDKRQEPRQNDDKRHDTTGDSKESLSPSWQPPEGYILIDKGTLDAIKSQLTELTGELKQMRTTQQLLIEKGLNLNQIEATGDTNDTTATRQEPEVVAKKSTDKDKNKATKQATGDTKQHGGNKKRLWGIVGLVFTGLILILLILYVLEIKNVIHSPFLIKAYYWVINRPPPAT